MRSEGCWVTSAEGFYIKQWALGLTRLLVKPTNSWAGPASALVQPTKAVNISNEPGWITGERVETDAKCFHFKPEQHSRHNWTITSGIKLKPVSSRSETKMFGGMRRKRRKRARTTVFFLHIVSCQYQSALRDFRDQQVTLSFSSMSYFGVLFGCFSRRRVF